MSHPGLYKAMISLLGATQGLWSNKVSRKLLSVLPKELLPTRIPYQRYLPKLVQDAASKSRYPELADIPASQADIAYFYGCSSDLFAEPIADSFIRIAQENGWKVSLPPSAAAASRSAPSGTSRRPTGLPGTTSTSSADYKYVIAHCPSCLYGIKEYAKDFARMKDKVYEEKARALIKKLYEPAQFIMEVIGADQLQKPAKELKKKVTVHLSCHEKLGQKMTATTNHTRSLLKLIPGLEIVEMEGANDCCGLAGPWGLGRALRSDPEAAAEQDQEHHGFPSGHRHQLVLRLHAADERRPDSGGRHDPGKTPPGTAERGLRLSYWEFL